MSRLLQYQLHGVAVLVVPSDERGLWVRPSDTICRFEEAGEGESFDKFEKIF